MIKTYRHDPSGGSLRLGFLVVAAVYSVTEAAFKIMHPVWIAFFLAIMIVPQFMNREEETAVPMPSGPRPETAPAMVWVGSRAGSIPPSRRSHPPAPLNGSAVRSSDRPLTSTAPNRGPAHDVATKRAISGF